MNPHLLTNKKNLNEALLAQLAIAMDRGGRVANAENESVAVPKQDWRDCGRIRLSSRATGKTFSADALLFDPDLHRDS
jgi:hypothetical protein